MKKLIIWGTGLLSRSITQSFDLNADCYVDNNASNWNQTRHSVPIQDPASCACAENQLIIASIHFYEIYQQALELGYQKENISIATETKLLSHQESITLISHHEKHQEWIATEIAKFPNEVVDHTSDRMNHLKLACQAAKVDGLVLEFGVYKGASITHLAKETAQHVYGFDSFSGLPEDWTLFHKKDFFDLHGIEPEVSDTVDLVKGYFQDTLPDFLTRHTEAIRLIHLDADLYSSTSYVLEAVKDRLQEGSILIFDDYFYELDYDQCDYRAFNNFQTKYKIKVIPISISKGGSIAFQVL
ncbi:TylF/MycF/NovP-related O-methyltransferase [Temperatibacter marinus]|uniref:TylF/MycF/NovP-related O-methyltransferase n=1 Tax=Temperatibacter marinus TaxID=1456591 RepID=A0AA52EHM8_9PROT|nr:TylF/MycF/NovP-related O-methyltransferase [Temperatibacter marinus]WND03333.1 TylF/MycF/NovP-related O-methyltransferase [Temperatibacter marinus]